MKRAIPYAGMIVFLLIGWLAGRCMVGSTVEHEKQAPPPMPQASSAAMPRDFSKPGANGWLAALDTEQIAGCILRVAKEPETRHREQRLMTLFGRAFELNATVAADLWLQIEGDCQPDLKDEVARWVAVAPEEAVSWFSRSVDQLRRYRAGQLVVDLAKLIIESITKKDPDFGVRLLIENPAFYDSGSLFYVVLGLISHHDARLLENVAIWAARQGDDPTNSLRTLSGLRIDAGPYPIRGLAGMNKDAALNLFEQLSLDDPRRNGWQDEILSGWSGHDTVAAMTWWVGNRPPDQEWSEYDIDPLMDWARSDTNEWLAWMIDHVPVEVADRAMAKAIELTSPPSLMHLQLCAAIQSAELRKKASERIRSKGDLDKLRELAEGRPDLEKLLDPEAER